MAIISAKLSAKPFKFEYYRHNYHHNLPWYQHQAVCKAQSAAKDKNKLKFKAKPASVTAT